MKMDFIGFSAKFTVKGRIYIFYLIQLFIQVWKKKEVYGLIENIKKVWEELSWQKMKDAAVRQLVPGRVVKAVPAREALLRALWKK